MQPVDIEPERRSDSLSGLEIPAVVCVSCGGPCHAAYCSACGQRQPTGRHTLRSVLGGILGRFISIENGFGRTAALLTTRPGAVITGYWGGQTIRYTHPAGYLLVSVAVFALALRLSSGPTGAGEGDRLFALLILPFVAAASRALLWRAHRNYAEHLIAVLYLCGHAILALAVLSVGLSLLSGAAATVYRNAALIMGAGYFLWGYSQAFPARPVMASIVGLTALVLGAAAWVTLMAVLVNLLGR